MDRTQIIERALALAQAAAAFTARARRFFYAVTLHGHTCPDCGGSLSMEAESRCRCHYCDNLFDPTVAFQRCATCGGTARMRMCRYECADCRAPIVSRYLFDGRVFNAAYFRQKMAEHRQRKQDLRERVRQMLAGTRSSAVSPPAAELTSIPGLLEALNSLSADGEPSVIIDTRERFDLGSYQRHIQAHLGRFPANLENMPSLSADARRDRVWRFIAIIFLAHAGLIEIWQEGPHVMVMKLETDREGQELPGGVENADGVERSLGRVEA